MLADCPIVLYIVFMKIKNSSNGQGQNAPCVKKSTVWHNRHVSEQELSILANIPWHEMSTITNKVSHPCNFCHNEMKNGDRIIEGTGIGHFCSENCVRDFFLQGQ